MGGWGLGAIGEGDDGGGFGCGGLERISAWGGALVADRGLGVVGEGRSGLPWFWVGRWGRCSIMGAWWVGEDLSLGGSGLDDEDGGEDGGLGGWSRR